MRGLTIAISKEDYEEFKAAWDAVADAVIPDEEAGQRGKKASVLFRMFCIAALTDFDATVKLLVALKNIIAAGLERPGENE